MTDGVRVRLRPRPGTGQAPQRTSVARAAALTAGLTVAGSGLGLVRDQVIARLFGAGAGSDAFLVAWTVPELAATVLIEDAMALLLVPAFSAALAKGGVSALVRGTLPRLAALLAAATAALWAAAPLVVHLLAPGLANPRLAVACTRLTAATIPTFGLTGYLSAALRAHRLFLPPAAVYAAYNTGIIATLLALHRRWGVESAAAGVAVGGTLMVLVQLPFFVRALRPGGTAVAVPARPFTDASRARTPPVLWPGRSTGSRRPAPGGWGKLPPQAEGTSRCRQGKPPAAGRGNPAALPDRPGRPATRPIRRLGALPGRRPVEIGGHLPGEAPGVGVPPRRSSGGGRRELRQTSPATALGPALVMPVVLFAVARHAQVLAERFFAAGLPAGAISHLNYAQKVAQLPMVMSLMVCTVTFPAVAGALATGDRERAGKRVERDLTLACVVVLVGTAYVIACAPQIVQTLFQRGAFDAADTTATAAVMRVYALGLLGQSLVGALIRPYFSAARPTWYPVAAMAAGLVLTVAADAAAVRAWGAYGIAAGNAAGITLTAAILLRGLPARAVPVRAAALGSAVSRYVLAAAAATGAGWCTVRLLPGPAVLAAAACCLTVPLAFAAAAAAAGAPVRSLPHAA